MSEITSFERFVHIYRKHEHIPHDRQPEIPGHLLLKQLDMDVQQYWCTVRKGLES